MSRLGFYIVRIYSTLRDALTKEEEEGQIDAEQSDPYVPLFFAGDKKCGRYQ